MDEQEKREAGQEETALEQQPRKTLPFAPTTERIQPSTLKILLMTLGVLGAMVLIGWIRSKIGI